MRDSEVSWSSGKNENRHILPDQEMAVEKLNLWLQVV
jgi:hypothetical protein